MKRRKLASESGVALLVALFALMLLSAIGMGMMFSANSETMIGSNYREVEIATFGAYSGIWEARDRLRYDTSTTSNMVLTYSSNLLTLPAGLPSTSAANVIYIINPTSGQTVAPWDYSNTYADTELCHENVMSLTNPGNGVACTGSSSLPSGSSWYHTVNDSSYGGAYQQTTPLAFKWARITLKSDNATTYPINGSPAGTQVCWDGQHQIPLPTGYNTSCGPQTGTINSVTVTSPGSGYTSAPTVSFSGGGGSGAAATASITTLTNGTIASITINSAGTNYVTAPTVTIAAPPIGGVQATATATIGTAGGYLTGTSYTSGSSTACWNSSPGTLNATLTSSQGTGGNITVNTIVGTCIAAITISGTCTWTNSTVNATLSGGGGSGAQVAIQTKGNGSIKAVTMVAGGSGYNAAPTGLTPTSGSCSSLTIGAPTYGYMVNTSSPFNITAVGNGYVSTSSPTITIPNPGSGSGTGTGGSGTTTVAATGNPGQVIAITVTNAGSGYLLAPSVTLSAPPSGSTATATANLGSNGTVTNITVTNAGSGYTSAPTVSLSGGGGSGAAGVANLTSGTYYGNVFLVTALGVSPAGARSMAQMEAVAPVRGMSSVGALTFDGSGTLYLPPNSSGFGVSGTDANSCGGAAVSARPAVGVVTAADVSTVVGSLPANNSGNYVGSNPAPDVENISNSLTATMKTPSGLEAFGASVEAVAQAQGTYYTGPATSIAMGSATNPVVDYVQGDLTISGNPHGYGILWVTGTLNFGGNFSWNGPIYVVGQGRAVENGGGSGQFTGQLFVAVTRTSPYGPTNVIPDSTGLGQPYLDWSGGGGNGIVYDHCWVDNLLARIPFTPPMTTDPLKVISVKTLAY